MGNPVYKDKDKEKKLSFLRQVITRSNNANRSSHPLRSLFQEPLEPVSRDESLNSEGMDDLETILLDNINPRIINMSVEQEESAEEIRLRDLEYNDLFLQDNTGIPSRSSFYRWQSLRGIRPPRSSLLEGSRLPRASFASIFRSARASNHQIPETGNN